MTDYVVRDTQLTSIADAIRAKGSTSAPISFPDGFVSAVQAFPDAITLDTLYVTENGVYTPSSGHAFSEVTVDVSGGGGDTDAEDGIITRMISGSYYNSRVKQVGNYAFISCTNLTTVNFLACKTIGSNAFYCCNKLTAASFPACTTIVSNAFYNCTRLATISFPVCMTIDSNAFDNCTSLATISFPACMTIGGNAFSNCTSLTAASFPACTTIYSNAFYYCNKLATISFPACKKIGSYVFYSCFSLTTISFPVCTTIGSSAFRNCRVLLSAYFLGSSIPTLANSNAYTSTPIAGYTTSTDGALGSIFVRASLLTAFQSATNWSFFSERIVGLTDEQIAALDNNS